jgi:hypothetical protein
LSDFTLKYLLALVLAILAIVIAALLQNWWESRRR